MKPARVIASFEAIGTHWWIGAYTEVDKKTADSLAASLEAEAEHFNQDYSRFLPDSFVTRLNDTGKLKSFPSELYKMLVLSEKFRQLSDGVFNVGVGRQLEQLGYDAAYSFHEKESTKLQSGSVFQVLNAKEITLNPGSRIDLGGLGKGWLIDKLAALIEASGIKEFYVNGGGDILACGHEPKRFALENPLDINQAIGELLLTSGAVAASSANKRAWTAANTGKSHHHLINPATGQSHNGPAGVYSYGKTATVADTASTILFLTPPEKLGTVANKLEVEYLVVTKEGRAFGSAGHPAKLYS